MRSHSSTTEEAPKLSVALGVAAGTKALVAEAAIAICHHEDKNDIVSDKTTMREPFRAAEKQIDFYITPVDVQDMQLQLGTIFHQQVHRSLTHLTSIIEFIEMSQIDDNLSSIKKASLLVLTSNKQIELHRFNSILNAIVTQRTNVFDFQFYAFEKDLFPKLAKAQSFLRNHHHVRLLITLFMPHACTRETLLT